MNDDIVQEIATLKQQIADITAELKAMSNEEFKSKRGMDLYRERNKLLNRLHGLESVCKI